MGVPLHLQESNAIQHSAVWSLSAGAHNVLGMVALVFFLRYWQESVLVSSAPHQRARLDYGAPISSVAASSCFDGALSVDMTELQTYHVPYPHIHVMRNGLRDQLYVA